MREPFATKKYVIWGQMLKFLKQKTVKCVVIAVYCKRVKLR